MLPDTVVGAVHVFERACPYRTRPLHSQTPPSLAQWAQPAEHGRDPVTDLYVPAGHAEHSPPSSTMYPALHPVLHPALPAVSLYLPAGHAVHSPPSGPVYPAMHSQSVTLSLPAADVASDDGQAKHSALPAVSLYLPAGHAVHSPPSGPVYPASHLQSVTLSLPAALVVA